MQNQNIPSNLQKQKEKKNVDDAEETNKPEETYKPITDINFTEV